MTRTKVDPDKPHKFQVRRVTWQGRPMILLPEKPCRHCGGSEFLPVHIPRQP